MAIKNLQILVIDKNPNPNHNLWTVDVKYTIIKPNLYFMVYSIVLKVWKDLVERYFKYHSET
jgi:hypothetical protein